MKEKKSKLGDTVSLMAFNNLSESFNSIVRTNSMLLEIINDLEKKLTPNNTEIVLRSCVGCKFIGKCPLITNDFNNSYSVCPKKLSLKESLLSPGTGKRLDLCHLN